MVQCYLILFLVSKIKKCKTKKIFLLFIVEGGINILSPIMGNYLPQLIYKLYLQTFIPYIWLFLFGVILCEWFEHIIYILTKFWIVILGLLLLVGISDFEQGIGVYEPIKSMLLGLFIIGFGYKFSKLNIKKIYHMHFT